MSEKIQMNREERLVCIDRFRGLIVFCMVFFQCAKQFEQLGLLSRLAQHDSEMGIPLLPNLMLADVFTPMFFLAIALNYLPSFRRRTERDGRGRAYLHFLLRYCSILGFGGCITAIGKVFQKDGELIIRIMAAGAAAALCAGLFLLLFGLLKNEKGKKTARNVLIITLTAVGIINLLLSVYDVSQLFRGAFRWKHWGVLQAIGGAGLLMLLFAESGTAIRGAAAALCFGIYMFIHDLPGHMELLDHDVQGGILAILAWGCILLIFSVMADLFYRDRAAKKAGLGGIRANSYLAGTAVLIVPAVFAAGNMVLNKGSVSPGYILVTVPPALILFWLISLTEKRVPKFRLFLWWGYNPILMFLLEYLTQDVLLSLVNRKQWPVIPALLYTLLVNAAVTWVAYRLYRKQRSVRL